MKILVLEDDHDSAESLVRLFAQAGHQATATDNGKDGLFLLETQDFDGAIVDLMMPELNGWEFLEHMDLGPKKIPVIVVSGFSEVSPPSPFHAVPVVTKPYLFDKLLALCERNFKGK